MNLLGGWIFVDTPFLGRFASIWEMNSKMIDSLTNNVTVSGKNLFIIIIVNWIEIYQLYIRLRIYRLEKG